MTCNCIAEINEQLKAQGMELDTSTEIKDGAAVSHMKIKTRWRAEKKQERPEPLAPFYCPRCGKKAVA